MPEFSEILDEFRSEKKCHRLEGSTGVKNLCRIVNAMGYEDPQNFGQFAVNGSYGDLINFLEDNPGACEALVEWIEMNHCQEWQNNLESHLPAKEEDESAIEELDEDDKIIEENMR